MGRWEFEADFAFRLGSERTGFHCFGFRANPWGPAFQKLSITMQKWVKFASGYTNIAVLVRAFG